MKKILNVSGVYFLLYIILFVIVPFICDSIGYSLLGAQGEFISGFITIAIISIGMIFCTDNLLIWLMCSVLYFYFLIAYIPEGAYGIGIWFGRRADHKDVAYFISLLITTGVTLFWVVVVWCTIKCIKIIKKYFPKNN